MAFEFWNDKGWDSPAVHDALGLLLHLITICVVYGVPGCKSAFFKGDDFAPTLLVGQEIVALVAHMLYTLVRWIYNVSDSRRNPWKWTEYSISATMGTIAALTIGGEHPDWFWVAFLALTGAGQQFIGYQIDVEVPTRMKIVDKNGQLLLDEPPQDNLVTRNIKISFFLAVGLQVRCAWLWRRACWCSC